MTRQAGTAVTKTFSKGLITEATGLNFPEDACTETVNCVHNIKGSIERRLGFDFEPNYALKHIDPTGDAISSYLWRDVAGDGDLYFYAVHIGDKLYFYNASTTDPVSAHALTSYIDLADYIPSGSSFLPNMKECQFSAGNGLLFVTHPYLDAFYVSYDRDTNAVTGTQIDITVRDFKGLDEPTLATDSRPVTSLSGMTTAHHYNLLNQGWTATNLAVWDAGRTDMPSNADVMWSFKNSSDAFDLATVANVVNGNSPSPKGHYIFYGHNEDRATPSGLIIDSVTTENNRCSTNAFFAGRVFYAGTNFEGVNATIFFTQVIERPSQYGQCYQTNDPTSETLFDLLPSDGGTIVIRDAGTVIKMIPIPGGLAVFASNGVWLVTGSTGLGFTATDYTVSKVSSIRTLTHTSFVDIAGTICWWNLEGIYILGSAGQNGVEVKSLTHDKILSFFYDIPPSSKRFARGWFNPVTGVVQWLYRNTEAGTLDEIYQFDRVLNFNTFLGAFYTWELSVTDVHVTGLVVIENLGGSVETETVVRDNGNTVVDDAGETVIIYTINSGIVVPKFKYLVYYTDGSSAVQFTFAEERNTDYLDWPIYYLATTGGTIFNSYFTSGYHLRGDAIRKFQPTYLKIFSQNDIASKYTIKGLWDYASSGDTGRWSPAQTLTHSTDDFDYLSKRVKIRGHGIALQFRVDSFDSEPFHIIGWSEYSTGNAQP